MSGTSESPGPAAYLKVEIPFPIVARSPHSSNRNPQRATAHLQPPKHPLCFVCLTCRSSGPSSPTPPEPGCLSLLYLRRANRPGRPRPRRSVPLLSGSGRANGPTTYTLEIRAPICYRKATARLVLEGFCGAQKRLETHLHFRYCAVMLNGPCIDFRRQFT